MGAEQSTRRGGAGAGTGAGAQAQTAPQKTCYYELLSVERTATDDDIKKAYRRKALELHPDRNLGDTDNATRRFAEVQTAYEVLSDPQERAWYDSHRDAILRGDNGADDAAAGDDAKPRYYNNVRVTSTEELFTLMGRFNSSVAFDNSSTGFFGILEATFAQLSLEEEAAASWDDGSSGSRAGPVHYAPFGGADDDYETVARPFYRDWATFTTRKTFSWKDKYRLSDAPDRAVRRLMERDNKKAREQAIRDFNDAVRSLVAFVRKRDPRYVPNTQSEAERQQVLRDSAAAQAARQRTANLERTRAAASTYVAPIWAQAREEGDPVADEYTGNFSSDAESEVQNEIECVVCSKSFKSEKQFESHEKSKKHVKAVQQLRWRIRKENKDLHLAPESAQSQEQAPAEEDEDDKEPRGQPPDAAGRPSRADARGEVSENEDDGQKGDERADEGSTDEDDADDDDEYAPRVVVERRFQMGGDVDEGDARIDNDLAADMDGLFTNRSNGPAEKKVGKAKAKREKKAARQAGLQASGVKKICSICRGTFASNTKLHNHLREAHTAAPPAARKGGQKKKANKTGDDW